MSSSERPGPSRSGFFYALGAYLIWGMLPLYFLLLAPSNAFEIVAWRVIWALVVCAILITIVRGWQRFFAVFRQPRLVLVMGLAGVLIYVNWQVYVIASTGGHVLEASLGYFINPIVTILLGVFILRERLRMLQWVSLGISLIAVVVLTIGYGAIPWISLILAGSFGLYGLVKKQVGPRIDAVNGLTLESLWLLPFMVVQLSVVGATTGLTFASSGGWHAAGLVGAGVVTAAPLLLFASASKRLPLVYLGFVQYLTPILQFIVGVFLLGEPMPPERLIGFAIVWLALIVLSIDLLRAGRARSQNANDLLQNRSENILET
ncbi:EamA family transporter RarD [Subtercola boreus]|uniref:EamA family transporter n=1 Tax=Subtercola boreus TaxID=120213 RepID=A0A3E0WBH4_9MICO|nr:EamA family transporter RarD [Subtercola boreus]RFA19397.1 EamA family transporter [Subtercola boreus]RFA19658.1 EamA family transporter [Subtercola boreus]RFA26023.1 EamA family transporter [Subtercola boreus]